MLQVNWIKCGQNGHWCSFADLDLASVKAAGVYVIWHEGNPGRIVYVGQGDIAARVGQHRNNPEITAYAGYGKLRITWASVSVAQRDGVERYLADKLNPLVGDVHPDAQPIAVNW